MRTHFCLFLSCLLVLSLFAASVSSQTPAPPAAVAASMNAGERMALTINGIECAFRWCPAGTFMMGDGESQYRVGLSRGFWMLETQVTQAMWESVMGNNPSHFKGAKLPVETVSWNDCQEFIKKLNDMKVAPAGFKRLFGDNHSYFQALFVLSR